MIKTEIQQHILKKTLGLTLAFSAAAFSFAQQQQATIEGRIVTNDGKEVPYASVTFTHKTDNSLSDGALTDEHGKYTLKLSPGDYNIKIDAPGFEILEMEKTITSSENMGDIEVYDPMTAGNNSQDGIQNIQEVTINAVRKPYQVELDKRTYDVKSDITAIGGNLQDVLENVPSISVDPDGAVSMRGNSNIRFLINGKPSSLLGIDDDADALKAIPSEEIDRIEVITNPSAKFEASGTAGILNIILKKSRRMGFNGTVTGSLGYLPRTNLNTSLNWRRGNWIWYINGSGSYNKNKSKDTNSLIRKDDLNSLKSDAFPFTQTSNQVGDNRNERSNYNFNTGFVYDINENTFLNFGAMMRYSERETNNLNSYNETVYHNTTDFEDIYRERNSSGLSKNTATQFDVGLDHKFDDNGQNISISGSYQTWNSDGKTQILQESYINSILQDDGNSINNVNTDSKSKTVLLKADYELPIGDNSRFEAGARYDYNQNNYDYFVNQSDNGAPVYTRYDFTSNTKYSENVLGVYAQFRSKIGENFAYQLGLRSETSGIDIDFHNFDEAGNPDNEKVRKEYTKLFPSAFLSYNLSDSSQLLLNYSRRIRRPRAFSLIPFFSFNDDRNYFRGNPDLNPSYINSYEVGYSLSTSKVTFNPTIYYRKSEDEQNRYQYVDDTGAINTLPVNSGSNSYYGLDLNGTYDPFSWWKIMMSADLFGYDNKGSYNLFPDNPQTVNDFSGNGFSYRLRLNNTFRPTKDLSVQVQSFYRAGQKTATTDRKGMYGVNIGASQKIWNGDGTLTFNVRDVFNSRGFKNISETAQFSRISEMKWSPRQFSISLTYNFRQGDSVERRDRKKDMENNFDDNDLMPQGSEDNI